MKTTATGALLVLAGALSAPAGAAEVEASLLLGQSLPFYSQTFTYQGSSSATLPLPGTSISSQGSFAVDAHGGLTAGATVAWDFAGGLGLEARIDTAAIKPRAEGGTFHLTASLPAPLPPLSTNVALEPGEVEVDRLRPVSLDLRWRTRGRLGVAVSAGVSWLPAFEFTVRQPVALAVPGLGQSIGVGSIPIGAEATPSGEGESRLGGNAGLALRFRVGRRVDLLADARAFYFAKQTISWGAAKDAGGIAGLPGAVAGEIANQLDPLRFNPGFFHAAVGVAFRL